MLADLGMLFVWLAVALIPTGIFSIFGLYFLTDILIKKKTKGATLIVFWDANKDEKFYLMKLGGTDSFRLPGKTREKKPTYIIDKTKQHFRMYPYWAPNWMQVRLPTYYFNYDNTTAIDPSGQEAIRLISPSMLGELINENTLSVMARVAKDTAEQVLGHVRKIPIFTLILVVIVAALVIWNIIATYQTGARLTEIEEIIKR